MLVAMRLVQEDDLTAREEVLTVVEVPRLSVVAGVAAGVDTARTTKFTVSTELFITVWDYSLGLFITFWG